MKKGMETHNRFENIERNPITHASHRKEVFWQITLPLVIGLVLVLAAAIAVIVAATQPVSELRRWADVSMIWLIIPAMFIALIAMVVLFAMVYAITAVLRLVPRYAVIALFYVETAREKVSRATDAIVEPLLKARSSWAALRSAGRKMDSWRRGG